MNRKSRGLRVGRGCAFIIYYPLKEVFDDAQHNSNALP